MRKVSIVMTYNNRPQQLFLTLRSLQEQVDDDVEIIIIDDGSTNESTMAKPIADQFHSMNIQVTFLPADQKWYTNPCIPFNKGFGKAKNEIVVITNAECFHVGKTIEYIRNNLNDSNYLSFSAYATLEQNHSEIGIFRGYNQDILETCMLTLIKPKQARQWFNHPTLIPRGYHFLSAITKNNLDRIGGFNRKFATGYCFDDDEFVWRISQAGLNIEIVNPESEFVIHQWHEKNPDLHGGCPLWEKNRRLWISITGGKRV